VAQAGEQTVVVMSRNNTGILSADAISTPSHTAGVVTLPNQAAAPATPVGGDVLYATSAGVLTWKNMAGLTSAVSGSQGGLTATTTVANSAVLSPVQSLAIPAGDAIPGAVYRLVGWGTYSDTGTPTLTFSTTFGATTIATVPAITLGAAVTAVPFKYETMISFYTATTVMGVIELSLGTSAVTDAASLFVATPTAAVTVTTAAQAFAMNVTWSAASPSNTISVLGGYSERLA
jgi:hypothetical protein